MSKKSKIQKIKNKGFTLVEVILVVAIITIMSAIAVPQVGKYMNKANRSKVVGAVADLNNSLTAWSIENNGDIPKQLSEIFSEYEDIKKLGIGLENNGKFKVGNITGEIILENGEIYAKILENSKAYPGDEIKR